MHAHVQLHKAESYHLCFNLYIVWVNSYLTENIYSLDVLRGCISKHYCECFDKLKFVSGDKQIFLESYLEHMMNLTRELVVSLPQ